MNATDNRTIEPALAHFKRGDDHRANQEGAENPAEAFRRHATLLRADAETLEKIADALAEAPDGSIEVQADTHMICITAPAAIAERLIAADLAYPFPDETDEAFDDAD